MFKLALYNPKVTWDTIDIPRTYEYGPSICNGRIFYVSGLGTDTITSVRLDGQKPSIPFWNPNKLVADPCAVKDGFGYIVYHTVGELRPGGLGNGVSMYRTDGYGNPIKGSERTLIHQNGQGTYGTGQPGYAKLGNDNILFVRQDGPGGVNTIGAYLLNSKRNTVVGNIPFMNLYGDVVLEDGASPEIFVWKNKIHMLVSAGGPVGFRSYLYVGGALYRETHFESNHNGFYAQNIKSFASIIDGAGIVRDKNNLPIVNVDNQATIWYGAGDGADPGTWMLKKGFITLP